MKLVRYGALGKEKPGLIDAQGKLRDLSGVCQDIAPVQLGAAALAKIAKIKADKLPLVKGTPRLGCPVAQARSHVCVVVSRRLIPARTRPGIGPAGEWST